MTRTHDEDAVACALCGEGTAPDAVDRVSGIDLCARCRAQDPTEALTVLGFEAEWDTRLQRFSAGLGIPEQAPDFYLSCSPELWHHKLAKLVTQEVEVGDPAFDGKVYVRTSDPARAVEILGNEGIQSALLALLTGVRVNELAPNHVTLEGPTLTVSARPAERLSPERIVALQLETAALALHLRAFGAARGS